MRLIIVRHAETVENLDDTVCGHMPGILTEKGRAQAKKLALRLQDEKLDAIYSSDLTRARETTEEIAKFHDCPVHYDPEVRERNLGVFEGRLRTEYFEAQKMSSSSVEEFKPEGGESFLELKERAWGFLTRLLERYEDHEDKTVLISSHGGWIKNLFVALLNISLEEILKTNQENTCVNIIEIGDDLKAKAVVLNDTGHL